MPIKRMKLMCDFETTTDPKDVRVWAACAVDIDSCEVVHLSNSIETFFRFLEDKNTVCYWHNMKFDGEFVLSYLLRKGYKYSEKPKDKTFRCLISDTGLFYSIEIVFKKYDSKKYKKTVFYDSLKKLPFKVATIAKAFNLEMSKGEIDYKAPRPVGHQLTEEEKDYIIRDCKIVAQALKIQFEQGLKKMTNASDAMGSYKEILGKGRFEKIFPVLPFELDKDIRRAYKGGFVYLNPNYKNTRGLQGITFDINSLYPWTMRTQPLPYGYPVYFEGEPKEDKNYPLFIVHMVCQFKLKRNHIPTIQLKNNYRFMATEYLTESRAEVRPGYWDDEPVELWLTSVDYELFMDHYDVWDINYINGFRFKAITGMFDKYIDHWMEVKEKSTGAIRALAKLQLNSLYGRFALNPKADKKIPYLDDDGVVKYEVEHCELRDPVYCPVGAFVTAHARNKTIRSAQLLYDRFIYADTDSLHIHGFDIPDNLDIHPTRLGAWKNEGAFSDSKFIRAKTYMETVDGVTKVTCAGMPDNVKELVTYDNFHSGFVFPGKLVPRRYPGGIVLEETTFTIM